MIISCSNMCRLDPYNRDQLSPSNDVGKVECKMVIILIAFEEQCTCSCHVGTGIVNETNKKECLEYICKEKELDPFDWSEILVVTDTGHVYQYSI